MWSSRQLIDKEDVEGAYRGVTKILLVSNEEITGNINARL